MCTLDDFQQEEKTFKDGEYTVWAENIQQLKPGDVIFLTTSEKEYDCMCGCFMNDIPRCARVNVEILNEDHAGDDIVYASAKVKEVIEVGY
ncbi:hypothetical protein [Methanobrevibacter sp.]|uniref:hypothetical protein n=1 Tax=Methanobrevibacter sp. TaxID=66852 RepID=UPI00388DD88C